MTVAAMARSLALGTLPGGARAAANCAQRLRRTSQEQKTVGQAQRRLHARWERRVTDEQMHVALPLLDRLERNRLPRILTVVADDGRLG